MPFCFALVMSMTLEEGYYGYYGHERQMIVTSCEGVISIMIVMRGEFINIGDNDDMWA